MQLLDEYLSELGHGRQASPHTLRAYRSDLSALLGFASDQSGTYEIEARRQAASTVPYHR